MQTLRRFLPLLVAQLLPLLMGNTGLFGSPSAQGKAAQGKAIEVLFLGDNGPHQPEARFAELQPIMNARGISLTYTEDLAALTPENLQKYDAVLVYANIDRVEPTKANALIDYVRNGGGFVPLHCASYCFRNVPELVQLMGAQFQRHGTGVFRSRVADVDHDLIEGYGGFESWDETYVHHKHNPKQRTVLEYRVDDEGREPWTWIRHEGDGRVFYTAWGHDARTWTHPGFHNLVERGIRWAVKRDPQDAGPFLAQSEFPVPSMKRVPSDLKPMEYVDVGAKIPNYTPSSEWGTQGDPLNMMQKPLAPEESMKHLVVPEGFHVELFASEPQLGGKPICMAWDERGRLWVAETVDYPNQLKPDNRGRDRIRICEDTDGDGQADRFTVFAEGLSIPTSITFSRGGAIVQNGTETLFLKDNDGDDRSDERRVLVKGWELGDTHGGVSNFQYGLDNWIWAMQGYNNSKPVAKGTPQQRFRMGFFRMKTDGSEVEFIRSTNNNTWGLGISEEGLIFGSTANGNPSIFMPIANRYYEQVRGWTPSLTLSSIADSNDFDPITENVRQVDHHGGYTAAAGHALYTAREYPPEYWNRVAFVNGPTGHLVGSFVLDNRGTEFRSTSPFNLLASDDEWTAPIMAEVGPDGQVWVIDWYNYIVQHNPTPQGFETGAGRAYETELRDKKHGRIYRIVADSSSGEPFPNLAEATPDELVAALAHPTMLVRKHAQRLLVERGKKDIAAGLLDLLERQELDATGLDVGAIHAIWTLHGLGLLDGSSPEATEALFASLRHPSAGVRLNAVQALPNSLASVDKLLEARLHRDRNPHVRLASLLTLADLPASNAGAKAILQVMQNPSEMADRWLPDAATSAAANHSAPLLRALADAGDMPERATEIIGLVAEHHIRGKNPADAAELLANISQSKPETVQAVIAGFRRGWKDGKKVSLNPDTEAQLETLLDRIAPEVRGQLVKLASGWGSERFSRYGNEISEALLETVRDESLSVEARSEAAHQLVQFRSQDSDVAVAVLDVATPRTPSELSIEIIRAAGESRWEGLGEEIVRRLAAMTPQVKDAAIAELLKRPSSTMALLSGIESQVITFDDLALDQKQSLASHPSRAVRRKAGRLLERGGSLPNSDRQRVLEAYATVVDEGGSVERGRAVFKEHCSKCHIHGDIGKNVGPDLTGMAVHPKEELLVHILDPSRNVEGNFRAYSVLTADGLVLTGMLASESKTAIELIDTEGKRKSVLREDIDQLVRSTKSIMPEGFESSISQAAMADLLEFLTQRGKFTPIDLTDAATLPSDRSMFANPANRAERLIFEEWGGKAFAGVPFRIIDPRDGTRPNAVVLHGPAGEISRRMPKSVTLPVNGSVKTLHLLSGIAGWGHPFGSADEVVLTVRLRYEDGQTEEHDLVNGKHFADYIRRVDVPDSQFAFDLRGRQLRYLTVSPKRSEPIAELELISGPGDAAPVVMAITVESPENEQS